MISIVMPYWDRQEAANKALRMLARLYSGIEVVIVDDGNKVPFVMPVTNLDYQIVRLPLKDGPKNPSTCFNAGVKAAKHDIIVLTNPEILHATAILGAMVKELANNPRNYVLAATYCPDEERWHCHSKYKVPENPAGTGLHFCAMLTRQLYEDAGGFDEAYRDGAGYEDNDFINRLLAVGAKFVIRDDLVVIHPKSGAKTNWDPQGFLRNKALFDYKWTHTPINFVCLKSGTAFGPEYVNNLYDMVKRNLPLGYPGTFYCITDDATHLHPDINILPLPVDLEKWWGKLYMFQRGLFPDGSRMVFMDLDTLILGSLKNVVGYKGQFATLTDFYHPERLGPAIMMWEAGAYNSFIWEEWVRQGKPRNDWGDLWWLNQLDQGRFAKSADKLQKLYPGTFVSYKAHCRPNPPKGARVVCFHGLPRPHQATDDWVKRVWRINGRMPADLEVVPNTDQQQIAMNVKSACARSLPWVVQTPPNDRVVAIVGGGPSLKHYLPEIRHRVKEGMKVVTVNGTHDFLVKQGIVPDTHIIIDARPENERFITQKAKSYVLASQCSPLVFDKAGANVTIAHMHTEGILDMIPGGTQPICLISSGTTVGLAAIAIEYCLGHRKFAIYGMESSYDDSMHAFPQSGNEMDQIIEAEAGGKVFKTTPWMVAQTQNFQELAASLMEDGCEIQVRCGGLLGHIAWTMMNQQEA